jgi:hypothetical protein
LPCWAALSAGAWLVDYLIIDSTWAGGLTTWPHRLHPRVLRRPDARPALVRAVSRAPGHRRRLMALPEAPGLGLELRDETLEKYGVKLG